MDPATLAAAATATAAAVVAGSSDDGLGLAGIVLLAWPVVAIVVRPFLPPGAVAALGPAGKLLEVVCGNFGHAKNRPIDQTDRITPMPK